VDTFDLLVKGWPILLAIVTLIIVLSKLDLRVAVLEEKIKTLFDLWNKNQNKEK
jgi:hypothetical protein